ncbi:MAG: MBL fold metallo-hydrolase [Candidatus Brocadia sp.]|nr:MBL fold metallo-hydrolase [Candidatus Brocadia sp.]
MMIHDLILKRFTVGSFPINGYLVADPMTRVGAFIDPGGFSEEIEAFVKERKILLQHLFITHGHWDHTEGLTEFTSRYQLQSYAGEGEVDTVSHSLRGGETIKVGHLRIHALPIPGHTPCGISYYVSGCVFTGDALFCGTVGGTGSLKEAKRQIDHIRKHIFSLPDETMVFPAHGPMTTVGIEKYTNPFFR